MGEVELQYESGRLIIHAEIICYGDAANEPLVLQVAKNIADQWNHIIGKVEIKRNFYNVWFDIAGIYNPSLTPQEVYENTDPRVNYFRIEKFAEGDISFVDGIGCNTGYFKLDNLLNDLTTAAHEFGHTLGLHHPADLDIRHVETPGIMYPRGTIVKPEFQYNPAAPPATVGGTLNPVHRKVLQEDINLLHLDKLRFTNNKAIVGAFSSVWHDKHIPL